MPSRNFRHPSRHVIPPLGAVRKRSIVAIPLAAAFVCLLKGATSTGPTRLIHAQLAVIKALAAHHDINLWLTHTSPAMWHALAGRRMQLRRADDDSALLVDNPLPAGLSHDIRELRQQLGRMLPRYPPSRIRIGGRGLAAVRAAGARRTPGAGGCTPHDARRLPDRCLAGSVKSGCSGTPLGASSLAFGLGLRCSVTKNRLSSSWWISCRARSGGTRAQGSSIMTLTYDDLAEAVSGTGDVAMVSIVARYQADADGAKVFPPTFPLDGRQSPYVLEPRKINGEVRETVQLDQFASQANRVEEVLERERRRGALPLPAFVLRTEVDADRSVRLSSLEWPHRYADAYGRDCDVDGQRFDESPVGRRLRLATADDASALLERSPESLLLGSWDSHRPGRQAKFPRVYRSELIGLDPVVGDRYAGRMDPLNLTGKAIHANGDWQFGEPAGEKKQKGEKLSELGHGHIKPGPAPGGVTMAEGRRLASLSFAGLRRLSFGDAPDSAATAARAALAALAMAGDRLAFSGPSLWLRSGCELILIEEEIRLLRRGGGADKVSLDPQEAVALYKHAATIAKQAGLPIANDEIELVPRPNLTSAIRFAFLKAAPEDQS